MISFRLPRVLLLLCALLGALSLSYFYLKRSGSALFYPRDVGAANEAGRVERIGGVAKMRPASGGSFVVLQQGSVFPLKTFFEVPWRQPLEIVTHANWIVALDGGEFVFEDAYRNSDSTARNAFWYVKNGSFRARSYDFGNAEYLLEVRTDVARIVIKNGEIGMKISEGGRGQVWLVKGSATVFWKDGRSAELGLRQLAYL